MERLGHPVELVPARSDNLKITHPEDLVLAQAVLAGRGATDPR
jgi:2-C-methyl-D-erythritol 4-phosphate cytidylyltransferase